MRESCDSLEAEAPVHRPTVHPSVLPLSGSNGDGVLPWTRQTPAFAAPKTTEAVRSSLRKIEQEQVVKQCWTAPIFREPDITAGEPNINKYSGRYR